MEEITSLGSPIGPIEEIGVCGIDEPGRISDTLSRMGSVGGIDERGSEFDHVSFLGFDLA